MNMIQDIRDKTEWFRIRLCGVDTNKWMQADGTWGAWKTAKRFRVQAEAEGFAEIHSSKPFGLFTYNCDA